MYITKKDFILFSDLNNWIDLYDRGHCSGDNVIKLFSSVPDSGTNKLECLLVTALLELL